ncbi:GNAT family N-acetyltransferase [uncultured Dubosiella sp.]|uniref:GNAT family N-acetyltransferase n=2 Tax=uncultured Dubosiella sp. TaxID=1937011 RepID=UPI0020839D9B|nr:GNAT family N-acetyltransferase [uncultured Dubosiella sp.]GJM57351.1 hypothetical protein EROP_10440 [Erysipelotrichaceae bacterium OPF54]
MRRFGKEDIDAFFDIFSDPEFNTYLPWFPLKNKEEMMPFMEEKYLSKYRQPQSCHYAICLKTDKSRHDLPLFLCRTLAAKK